MREQKEKKKKKTNNNIIPVYQCQVSQCVFAMSDLDPKNVLSPPGQCHFNEVDSVVMVDTENHLAVSYPCHKRGLLSPAVPNVPDSLPALSFSQHHSTSCFITGFQLKPYVDLIFLMAK